MRILSIYCILLVIVGCGSTPYNDDYAKHHNSLSTKDKTSEFVYFMSGEQTVDLRGSYKKDDSVSDSSILYAGDAGIIGMLVQVGIHSATINSRRDTRLTQAQLAANEHVSVLIDKAKTIDLQNMLGNYESLFVDSVKSKANTVYVKPIFFSNTKKNSLHMKLVAWIPKPSKKKTKKPQFRYKNSIQVYSKKLNEEEAAKLIAKDSTFLQAQLSNLMQMGLYTLNKDVKGLIDAKLKADKPSAKTYTVGNESSTVYRGKLVEKYCDFSIVKDLHSWLIAFPTPLDEESGSDLLNVHSPKLCAI